ncbi:MAG: polysaccharide biosynthesis protein [Ruminococcus sp.]|nr:polysaccharide biosynthesis protein [Ruminococcus sp.]
MKKVFGRFGFRKTLLVIADIFIITVAAIGTDFIFSFTGYRVKSDTVLCSIILTVPLCIGGLLVSGAYSKLWRYFNKKDYFSCVLGILFGMSMAALFKVVLNQSLYMPYVLVHFSFSIIGVCLFRFLFKTTFIDLINAGKNEAKNKSMNKRTMIIGAGTAGRMLLSEIHHAQQSPYDGDKISASFEPVCFIDDDRSKVGSEIEGVPIVGSSVEIPRFVKELDIEQIIFAIPSCFDDERKAILDICSSTSLPLKVIPFLGNLIFDDKTTTLLKQVRDIRVEDLLGRPPITFDNKDIRDFISGKTCLVTGGGGSIGSELVRQIAKYSPKKIVIVDIYENNAYEIQQELIMEHGSDLDLTVLIASVRDYDRMNQIFERFKPDIVFHAAAHKHVPLMETSPMEAIKNNVFGTFNVATLAQYHDVKKFVMISTDKAVNPTNVMGASKRCCEMVVQYLAQQNEGVTDFVVTRFGNVLGSNGSVIPLFKKQIEQGKPVTVTHPDIIRYFMTIPEAVSLVLEAAAIADGGEIFVLDMGKPVRILALAENLIRLYGKVPYKDVEIKFVGLRPGEKIKEELLMNEEGLRKTSNKLIFIGKQIEIDADEFIKALNRLKAAAKANSEEIAVQTLHDIVPTFTTPEQFNRAIIKAS